MSDKPFFIGFLPPPRELRGFLISCALSATAFFVLVAVTLGMAQDAPEDAGAVPGRQTLRGNLALLPYPVLYVTVGNDRVPAGRTILLAGQGKNGVISRTDSLRMQTVEVSGQLLARGDLEMLQLRGGQAGLVGQGEPLPMPAPEPLGRWRLAGEICDGKCLAGAMRPGRGVAHKACAILCIDGGLPPVFVSSQPVEGEAFLLVAGPGGTLLPPEAERVIGQFVQIEGEITRHGTLLLFEIDPASIEVLP